MKKTKVVCIGEALIDRIRNKSDDAFTDFLGGAPANVACALKKLETDSVFLGCLGDDEFGGNFIEKFNELGVNIDFLQLDRNFPTRIVKVNRDNFGDRYFSGFDSRYQTLFADEVLSWDVLKKHTNSLEQLFLETKYFVTGTIILSSPTSAECISNLLREAKKFDIKIIVDLNWREVFWDCSSKNNKREKVNLIKNFLKHSHILKMAKEEAVLFFENEDPREISGEISNKPDVVITDGGNPISWFINGFQGTTKVINSSKIVDTTGAGDAFLAGLISKLTTTDNTLTELEIKKYVEFASVCGYLTCIGEGAIEQQPNSKKVNQFIGSQIL